MSDKKTSATMRLMSDLLQRVQLASRAGLQKDGGRDLYKVFGWKVELTSDDMFNKYERQDIASRIVDAPPKATWSKPPIVRGGAEFDDAWKKLARKHKIWAVLQRADRLAAMGRFSGVMLGLNDGQNLERPINQRRDMKLLYLTAIGDHNTDIKKFSSDEKDEQFGRPLLYNVKLDDPSTKQFTGDTITAESHKDIDVHWQRIIHITENPLTDDIFSTPRLVKVFNLLDDILKISGGTAETFWLLANRGLQADIDKEMELDPTDAKELSDELEEFENQLRRIVRTRGVKLNPLGSDTPDPGNVFEMLISLLSGATGIPKRILVGSEQGSLASEQDRANWADRITERRVDFAQPFILEPLIDRLMLHGILPEADYEVEWPDAFNMSPLERAQMMAQKGRSATNLTKALESEQAFINQGEARRIMGLGGGFPETIPADSEIPPGQGGGEGEGEEGGSTE